MFNILKSRSTLALGLVLAITLAACGGDTDQAQLDTDMHGGMEGMHTMEGMHMDSATMARHHAEAQAMTTQMREHIEQMRALPPAEWHDHMGHHTTQVASMLEFMTRHMREMDMGMGMHQDQMAEMMGMSAAEHQQMMDDMAALRRDTEELQTASPEVVRDRMPAHLDRLENMIRMMERGAAHMHGDHGHM
jgi:Tfp pilus assembly protein PilV